MGDATDAAVIVVEIDDVVGLEVLLFDVVRVKKDDAPFVEDPAIAVVQSIDGGVELVMTPDGHHHEFTGLEFGEGGGGNIELSFTIGGIEFSGARGVRQIEAAGFAYALIVLIETRDGAFEVVTDGVIVLFVGVPIDLCVFYCRLCQAANDGGFAEEMVRDRMQDAFRGLDHTHRVLAGDELFPAAGVVPVASGEAGKN